MPPPYGFVSNFSGAAFCLLHQLVGFNVIIIIIINDSLYDVDDGNVQDSFIECVNFDGRSGQGATQRNRSRVNQIETFATEEAVRLVFDNENDIS